VPVEEEYRFETEEGEQTLAELFDGHPQLLVFHLMFGPDWDAACEGCSFTADHLDGAVSRVEAAGQLLDRAPLGRNEGWMKRHDEYDGIEVGR
jgi:predicted dithiol-disulfide oxidoreductase (DUF899 family)